MSNDPMNARKRNQQPVQFQTVATGVYLYELWYWSQMAMHPIIYLTGCSLTLAGALWLASDWFGL
jgi:hypothetical protein